MKNDRILLVSQDQTIITICKETLEKENLKLQTVTDCEDTVDHLPGDFSGTVLLDPLAVEDTCPGLYRYISEFLGIPVIVIGNDGHSGDRTRYLNAGADGFVEKPVDPDELLAEVKVVLRRTKKEKVPPDISDFACGDLHIDYNRKLVKLSGKEITLTPQEYRLLEELTLNAGATLSYQHLLHSVWGPDYIDKQNLYVYISFLRKKIEVDPRHPKHIITVTRVGYVFKSGEEIR